MNEDPDSITTNGRPTSTARLTLIGPMPPPIHGQTVATSHMVSELAPYFPNMRVANTRGDEVGGWLRAVVKVRRSARSWWSVRGADAVYIAVKADRGMWLTTVAAAMARLAGARLFLHHHSYAYVNVRKRRMVALTYVAGRAAHHIVLSDSMARQLVSVMPEISEPFVLGNAGLIDKSLLDVPLRADGADLVLGHMSDLSHEKGIGEVVDLALALHGAGTRVRLLVGGPNVDGESRQHLDRAERELGELFEYRGLLTGRSKRSFFEDITHFALPSRYVHEAVPLVLYEAMAAGAVCVATRLGSIAEQLEDSPCLLARSAEQFVEETLPFLAGATAALETSGECRRAYLRALRVSERQLRNLIDLVAGPG